MRRLASELLRKALGRDPLSLRVPGAKQLDTSSRRHVREDDLIHGKTNGLDHRSRVSW